MPEKTRRLKCLRSDKYAIIPSDGDSIITVKKGQIDDYPLDFAHRAIDAGAFVPVDKDDKSIDTGDIDAVLASIEEREGTLEKALEELEAGKIELEKNREEFESDKKKFAENMDAALDKVITDDDELNDDDDEPAEKSIEEQCALILKNAKDEKDAKESLIEFADNRLDLTLNMRFSSRTMIERINDAVADDEESE